jgi:hypothetical protein
MTTANFKIRDNSGNMLEVPVHLSMYNDAARNNVSLSQHLSRIYGSQTDEGRYGSVFSQLMMHSGMFLKSDFRSGLRAPTMEEISTGDILMSAITRNDGASRNTPAGKILFPEILMQTIQSELTENHDDFLGGWDRMIAQTQSINGPIFEQPVIDTTGPRDTASQPISQLALPNAMVSITTSSTPRKIITKSIGLQISDEAMKATTLDLVSLAVTAQARQERVRMVEEQINAIVNGDTDIGESALSTTNASVFDSNSTTPASFTHKAYIKWLRSNYRKRSVNAIITTMDAALAAEARSGKPTRDTVFTADGSNIGVNFTLSNLSVNDPTVLIVDDGVIAANLLVGLDTRYALRRVINVQAAYSAIEEFVLRKGMGLRVDYGETTYKLYEDAFDVLDIT